MVRGRRGRYRCGVGQEIEYAVYRDINLEPRIVNRAKEGGGKGWVALVPDTVEKDF